MTAPRRLALPVVAVVLSALMIPVGALAASPDTTGPAVQSSLIYGTVSAVSGTCIPSSPPHGRIVCTFTVTTVSPPASVTVNATRNTVFTAAGSAGVVNGFQVNDYVAVRGKSGSAAMTAFKVWYDPSPFPVPQAKVHIFGGKFSALDTTVTPNKLTVTHGVTTLNFILAPKTRYKVNGHAASNPTFQTGDGLRIWALLYTDGNGWTTQIWITRKPKR